MVVLDLKASMSYISAVRDKDHILRYNPSSGFHYVHEWMGTMYLDQVRVSMSRNADAERWLRIFGLCLLVFCTLALSLHAQNGTDHLTDSLKSELRSARSDIAKARIMDRLAQRLVLDAPDDSRTYASSALQLAVLAEHDSLAGFAEFHLANALVGVGSYEEGLRHAVHSQKTAIASGLDSLRFEATLLEGSILENQHRFEEAIEVFTKGKELATRMKNRIGIARSDHGWGRTMMQRLGDNWYCDTAYTVLMGVYNEFGKQLQLSTQVHLLSDLIYASNRMRMYQELQQWADSMMQLVNRHDLVWAKPWAHASVALAALNNHEYREAVQHYQICYRYDKAGPNQRYTANTLDQLSNAYLGLGRPDSALMCMEEALGILLQTGPPQSLMHQYRVLGGTYERLGMLDSAVTQYYNAFHLAFDAGEKTYAYQAVKHIGDLRSRQLKIDAALEAYQRAIDLARNGAYTPPFSLAREAIVLVAIGDLYRATGDNTRAEKYYIEAKELFVDPDPSAQYSYSYPLAMIALDDGRKAEAARTLRELIECMTVQESPLLLAQLLQGIAAIEMQEGNAQKALEHLQERLSILQARQVVVEIPGTLLSMSELYKTTGDTNKQMECLLEASTIAEEIGVVSELSTIYGELSSSYEKLGLHEHALSSMKKHILYRDSLSNERNQQALDALTVRYETEKKDKAILQLEHDRQLRASEMAVMEAQLSRRHAEIERNAQRMQLLEQEQQIAGLTIGQQQAEIQERETEAALLKAEQDIQAQRLDRETLTRNIFIASTAAAIFLAFLVVWRIRERRKRSELRAEAAEYKERAARNENMRLQAEHERERRETQRRFTRQVLESQETERKRIATELHDGVGQEVLVIKNRAMLGMQNNYQEKTPLLLHNISEDAGRVLEEMRRISRELRPAQLDRFGLLAAIEGMTEHIEEVSKLEFTLELDEIDGRLPRSQEMNVFRIIQEAVNNVLKHAEATALSIKLERLNGDVQLRIEDNGRGFDADAVTNMNNHGTGIGLRGMFERADILGGSVTVDSTAGRGTRITVSFPAPVGEQPSKE